MASHIYALVLFHTVWCIFSQLSDRTSIEKILNTKENENTLNFVAAFLLSTLDGSVLFGGSGNGHKDFFSRVKTSKQTWAHPIKHFYSVVGSSPGNIKILQDPTHCQNLTQHYRELTKHISDNKEEVHRCRGIKVLYLPYCDPSAWGPMGPCCRCEGAMRYYMNMFQATPDYPKWFMFSDDDYYTRTYKLEAILSRVDPDDPYKVNAISNTFGGYVHSGHKDVHRTTDVAMWFSGGNCTVPCTFGSTWLGYVVFSYGAMRLMEIEVKKRGLIHTCELWHTTHDVGLGIFSWEMSIPHLPVCCGPAVMTEQNMPIGTYFHHVGTSRTKDQQGNTVYQNNAMHLIWEYGAKLRGETEPNQQAWIEFERSEGLKQFIPSYPEAGFENSLFYRKVQFTQTVANQMQIDQLKNLSNFPLRRTDFKLADCQDEMDFHLQWRLEHSDEFPLNKDVHANKEEDKYSHDYIFHLTNHGPNEVKMCAKYLESIQNHPVHLSDFEKQLPALDDLERRSLRRQN